MENTKENKARFFALYYDQVVLMSASFVKGSDLRRIMNYENDKSYLTLKPIQSISDEDAIEVAYNIFPDQKESNIQGVELAKYIREDFLLENEITSFCADFLRSKGYALPFMGVDVETLVSWGWVKLLDINELNK